MIASTPKHSQAAPAADPIVYIIDDDPGIRDGLARLLRSVDLRAELFASARELMQAKLPEVPGCLILDVRLPGMSGLELHYELIKSKIRMPVIFISAYGDVPMSVRAMKAGAVDFITKPFRDQDILDAVAAAINADRARLDAEGARLRIQRLFDRLTSREKEVVALVVAGLMNKQIAGRLGVTETTIKIHRMHAMKKMRARTVADLVRMAEALSIGAGKPPHS